MECATEKQLFPIHYSQREKHPFNPKREKMKKEDLLGKELSNLYAIAKQVNNYFNDSDISFLSEKFQQTLMDYVRFSCTNEEQASAMLRKIEVNPGNTVDSIVNEITENLTEISREDYESDEVKELSYLMSLNRLMEYHCSNLDNLQYLIRVVYKSPQEKELATV
ncbi:hypothetical protein CLV82_2530 [Zeaxanthinibacter enoshimensis]|uniref:Uncharacterized protein n=2 Tax=Zeaxanthinibacter enoshimensis TaxID=392009 RepID=A0A4R6TII8_9FLAO|nr:hypothetical protein CLV82_2530 [Zeaxanthinibacter enoshimensis]